MPRKFKEARQINKFKVIEAATKLGISQPTLSAWEGERKSPGLDTWRIWRIYMAFLQIICLAAVSREEPIRMFPFQLNLCPYSMASRSGPLSMAGYLSMQLAKSYFPRMARQFHLLTVESCLPRHSCLRNPPFRAAPH